MCARYPHRYPQAFPPSWPCNIHRSARSERLQRRIGICIQAANIQDRASAVGSSTESRTVIPELFTTSYDGPAPLCRGVF